jgi:hypothetical protein
MIQQGEEVRKEFVRRVNALLDRLQKAAKSTRRFDTGPSSHAHADA